MKLLRLLNTVILDQLTVDETIYFSDYSQRVPLHFNCDDLSENMIEIIKEGNKQDSLIFEKSIYLTKAYRTPLEILSSLNNNNLHQESSTNDTSHSNNDGYSEIDEEEEGNKEDHSPKKQSSRFYGTIKKKKHDNQNSSSKSIEFIPK